MLGLLRSLDDYNLSAATKPGTPAVKPPAAPGPTVITGAKRPPRRRVTLSNLTPETLDRNKGLRHLLQQRRIYVPTEPELEPETPEAKAAPGDAGAAPTVPYKAAIPDPTASQLQAGRAPSVTSAAPLPPLPPRLGTASGGAHPRAAVAGPAPECVDATSAEREPSPECSPTATPPQVPPCRWSGLSPESSLASLPPTAPVIRRSPLERRLTTLTKQDLERLASAADSRPGSPPAGTAGVPRSAAPVPALGSEASGLMDTQMVALQAAAAQVTARGTARGTASGEGWRSPCQMIPPSGPLSRPVSRHSSLHASNWPALHEAPPASHGGNAAGGSGASSGTHALRPSTTALSSGYAGGALGAPSRDEHHHERSATPERSSRGSAGMTRSRSKLQLCSAGSSQSKIAMAMSCQASTSSGLLPAIASARATPPPSRGVSLRDMSSALAAAAAACVGNGSKA